MRLLIFVIFLHSFNSYGQAREYQSLLDTVLKDHGAIIIHSSPIKKISLDPKEMRDYKYLLESFPNKKLDTLILAQIIENAKSPDTTSWQENEMKNFLLVSSRYEDISRKHALFKLSLTDRIQIKYYNKQIRRYNATDPYDRDLYYFSRPVFDNSKKYAIVQWDNAHSGLGGGGGIALYQLQGDAWEELGLIMNWRY